MRRSRISCSLSRYDRKLASLHDEWVVDDDVDMGVVSSAFVSAASMSSGDDDCGDNGEMERSSVSAINPGSWEGAWTAIGETSTGDSDSVSRRSGVGLCGAC